MTSLSMQLFIYFFSFYLIDGKKQIFGLKLYMFQDMCKNVYEYFCTNVC